MTTAASLIPPLRFKSWLSTGAPNAFGTVQTLAAGTNTPLQTYVDSTATTQNTNPIQLNARGEAAIWTPPNVAYKFIEFDSLGNQINLTDQVVLNQLITLFGGTDTGAPNAYILNFTASFTSYAASPVIYWVPSNNNSGPSTLNVNGIGVVGIYNPNGTTLGPNQIIANQIIGVIYQTNIANSGNSGFVLISVGNFTGSTIGTFGTETPFPSAATVNLGAAGAHVVNITGTTTITSFGASASLQAPIYIVRFSGALTLTFNASTLILPGNANIITTAGDALIAQYLGAGAWKVLFYQYSSGSSNTKIKPGDTVQTSNTTLTPDPDLQSNTLGIGRYAFEIYLVFDSVAGAAGFKWTNDGTAVDSRGSMPALADGWVNTASYGPKADTFYGTTITYAAVATGAYNNQVLYKGSMLVSTPGTLGVSWAQGTSTASATTLRAGSYLTTTLLNTGSAVATTQRVYVTPGTGTETVPVGYNTLTIEIWGGSGGGGGGFNGGGGNNAGGGGGSSGSYSRTVMSVTGLGGDTINFTVGATGGPASAGTASSIANTGTLPITAMNAPGGLGGGNASSLFFAGSGAAAPAVATGGTTANIAGNQGSAGVNNAGGGNPGAGGAGISGIYNGGNAGGLGGTFGVGFSGGVGIVLFNYSV